MDRTPEGAQAQPVLLFDGECGLCTRVVAMLLRWDRRGVLRFTPLQGRPAQDFLQSHGLPGSDFSTLVFVPDWPHRERAPFLLRTDGVIAALRTCGGGKARALAALLAAFPRPIRDAGYRFVARTRRLLFGTRACPAPRPRSISRFF